MIAESLKIGTVHKWGIDDLAVNIASIKPNRI